MFILIKENDEKYIYQPEELNEFYNILKSIIESIKDKKAICGTNEIY